MHMLVNILLYNCEFWCMCSVWRCLAGHG